MNIADEFDGFYQQWCEKNNVPKQKTDTINKWWKLAWTEFTKDVLVPNWEKNKKQYLEMKILTNKEYSERNTNNNSQDVDNATPVNNDIKSSWDKVKAFLDSN